MTAGLCRMNRYQSEQKSIGRGVIRRSALCQQPNDGVQWNPYIRNFAMVPSGGFTSW